MDGAIDPRSRPFFVAGGTVPPGSPSYVERAADRELYEALLAGEFCYVLNSRQMGKSSLAVRTIAKLTDDGVRTAFVDLTRFGGATIGPEQWYAGLLIDTGRALGLRSEAAAWLKERASIGPASRYLAFLEEVVLESVQNPVTVMMDEIDAVRSLPFPTDELFAGLRQLHNGRASNPSLRRLTICLLGAALPSDLIRDVRVTPFNIGRRIALRDFTRAEALPFADAIGGTEVLDRVLHWTGGHPFLTQSLCSLLPEDTDVDALVREQYLDARARETDTNLADVGNRLLAKGDPNVDDAARANALSLYERTLRGKPVSDDESNPASARIKMSGVARVEGGLLKPRNRIYSHAFDRAWIRDNMPGQELLRQKKFFWKGVLRTAAVSVTVLAAIGGLAWNNYRLMRQAQYEAYVASMRTLPLALQDHNLAAIDAVLKEQGGNPARGWEWNFWYRVAHRAEREVRLGHEFGNSWSGASNDSSWLLPSDSRQMVLVDVNRGVVVRRIPNRWGRLGSCWLRDDRRVLVWNEEGWMGLFDTASGTLLKERVGGPSPITHLTRWSTSKDDSTAYLFDETGRIDVDLSTLGRVRRPEPPGIDIVSIVGERSGDRLFILKRLATGPRLLCIVDNRSGATKETAVSGPGEQLAVSEDGRWAAVSRRDGKVDYIDPTGSTPARVLDVGDHPLTFLSLSANGSRLLTCGVNREGRLFGVAHGRARLLESFGDASEGYVSPSGERVMLRYDNLAFYRVGIRAESPFVNAAGAIATQVTPEGTFNSYGTTFVDRRRLLGPNAGMASRKVRFGSTVAVSTASGEYAVVRKGTKLLIFDARQGRTIDAVPKDFSPTSLGFSFACLDVSAEGHWAAFKLTGSRLGLMNLASREVRVQQLPEFLSYVRFDRTGTRLLVGGSNGLFRVLSASTFKPLGPDGHTGFAIFGGDFSPDGKRIAVCGNDDMGSLIDIASGKRTTVFVGHGQSVTSIAWSPDGRRVATGSMDRTIRLWDPETGKELGIIGRHESPVTSLAFIDAGRSLASATNEGVAKLWITEALR